MCSTEKNMTSCRKFSSDMSLSTFISFIVICQVLSMIIGNVFGMPQQGNPCDANPCGENNICTSNGGAVSCECAPGFSNDDPNDLWKCVKSGGGNGVIVRGSNEDSLIDIPSRTIQNNFNTPGSANNIREPTTTDRPSFLPPKETVIGFDESGREVMFTAAITDTVDEKKRPVAESRIPLPKRRPINNQNLLVQSHQPTNTNGRSNDDHRLVGLNIDQIFNAECLSSEDCANNEYCNILSNVCEDACSLNVCGEGSLCKGKLHRPLCYCPKGYEGNPHEICNKTKSRAGQKFRKRRNIPH